VNTIRLTFQIIATSVLVLFCSGAAQDSVHPKLPAETTINKAAGRGDLLFVTVRLETGQELRFIVDTGAPGTLLDKSLETNLAKRVATRKIFWSGGKVAVDAFPAPKLYLGNTQLLSGKEVMTFDFNRLHYPGPPIMGVLGVDCLRHYCIQLDFAAQKMRFLNPEDRNTQGLGSAFSLVVSRGCFEVRENLAGLKRGNTMIDTGCNSDGMLTPTLFREWTNTPSSTPRHQACFPNGVLGGESYSKLDLHGGGDNNLLGLSLLARHLVTFNFPKRVMYLKRTAIGPLEKDYSFTNVQDTAQHSLQ
jgi:predicted aspartyl protease